MHHATCAAGRGAQGPDHRDHRSGDGRGQRVSVAASGSAAALQVGVSVDPGRRGSSSWAAPRTSRRPATAAASAMPSTCTTGGTRCAASTPSCERRSLDGGCGSRTHSSRPCPGTAPVPGRPPERCRLGHDVGVMRRGGGRRPSSPCSRRPCAPSWCGWSGPGRGTSPSGTTRAEPRHTETVAFQFGPLHVRVRRADEGRRRRADEPGRDAQEIVEVVAGDRRHDEFDRRR